MDKLKEFERKVGIKFNNIGLLTEALTHRSYLNENSSKNIKHNERLEFLGDAVLELSVTKFLFNKFPERAEGDLTAFRAALVNSQMLLDTASKLELGRYIRLSKGEEKDFGKGKQYILANSLEALIGAIYLDQGFEESDKFIIKYICVNIQHILDENLWRDAKSLFQEKAQEAVGITPTYEVIDQSGPDHKKHFVIGVYLGDEMIEQGEGFSKQEAQRNAAENALKKKGWTD